MNLHIPTMFAMILIASTIMAASLGVIAYRSMPDLRTWALALALQVVAYVLFSLRGLVSDWLSIVAANGLITASLSLYGAGLYRFHHRRYPQWLLWGPLTILVVGFVVWIDNYRARMLFGGAVWLVQCLYLFALVMLYRRQTFGRGQYFLGASALVFAASMVYRWVTLPTGFDATAQLTDSTPLVVFTYVSSLISTLLLSVGALTMIQERSEDALRVSEARYRQLVDSATQGICVLQDDQFRFVNPKTLDLIGCNESDLVNKPFLPLIHPEDREQVKANHAQRLEGRGEGLTYAIRMQTRHLGWRWMEISGVLFEWNRRPATLNFVNDITERREADDQIRNLAYHDTLTHLPNRRLLMDHLKLARAAYLRSGKHGAVVFIDLDNFKPLNDQHGHGVGDLLLIDVAQRLLRNIRGADTAARFGGDEFVVLLTELDEQADVARQEAKQVAEKLLSVLEKPYYLSSDLGGVTLTIEHRCTGTAGVVVFKGAGDADEVLIDRADAAMYQAKQAGRNCVRISEDSA